MMFPSRGIVGVSKFGERGDPSSLSAATFGGKDIAFALLWATVPSDAGVDVSTDEWMKMMFLF